MEHDLSILGILGISLKVILTITAFTETLCIIRAQPVPPFAL